MAPQENSRDLYKIQHAHDRFFRESMQNIDIARQLSFLTLPSDVRNLIDWETLEIVKEVWLDDNLREHRSDVIYRVKALRNEQWVYLLFEHKSAPDKKIHFQLLRYMLEIRDQHEKQNRTGGLSPEIIPIVICHCNRPCKFDNSMMADTAILEERKRLFRIFAFICWIYGFSIRSR